MEALGILRFWRNADVSSEKDDVRNANFTDEEETDDDDSFFDLNFRSPDRKRNNGTVKKDFSCVESPRDVFLSKNDFNFLNSKPSSPITTLRSVPKFKVFTLGFRKSSKCEKTESNVELKSSKLGQNNRLSPVFRRENSLRSQMLKESCDYDVVSAQKSIPKYLKLIKPLYVKASKKTKLTDSVTPSSSPLTAPVYSSPRRFSEGSRVGSFKIASRNLVKSRSASSVEAAPPSIRRRDESLLEQRNDVIQGAILHCKKSYASQDRSQLFRSATDPNGKMKNSCAEQKRRSI